MIDGKLLINDYWIEYKDSEYILYRHGIWKVAKIYQEINSNYDQKKYFIKFNHKNLIEISKIIYYILKKV